MQTASSMYTKAKSSTSPSAPLPKRAPPKGKKLARVAVAKPARAAPRSEYRTLLRLDPDMAADFKLCCGVVGVSLNHAIETLIEAWIKSQGMKHSASSNPRGRRKKE